MEEQHEVFHFHSVDACNFEGWLRDWNHNHSKTWDKEDSLAEKYWSRELCPRWVQQRPSTLKDVAFKIRGSRKQWASLMQKARFSASVLRPPHYSVIETGAQMHPWFFCKARDGKAFKISENIGNRHRFTIHEEGLTTKVFKEALSFTWMFLGALRRDTLIQSVLATLMDFDLRMVRTFGYEKGRSATERSSAVRLLAAAGQEWDTCWCLRSRRLTTWPTISS